MVDQASSYTDKNVEMKAINRQIKLISEIDKALARIREDIYGYCLDTAEPIGLKRLIARPVAKYTIAAQGDAMLVPKGNPKNINNYADVISTGAKLVTGAGFNTVEAAKKFGVPDSSC